LPLQGGGSTQPVAIAGRPVLPLSEQTEVAVRNITPGYVPAVRMHVVEGRDFTEGDTRDRPLAALVSASMARRFWPGEGAVGKRLTLGLMSSDAREVVGVVSDVKVEELGVREGVPVVYLPFTQEPEPSLSIVVRAAVPAQTVVP